MTKRWIVLLLCIATLGIGSTLFAGLSDLPSCVVIINQRGGTVTMRDAPTGTNFSNIDALNGVATDGLPVAGTGKASQPSGIWNSITATAYPGGNSYYAGGTASVWDYANLKISPLLFADIRGRVGGHICKPLSPEGASLPAIGKVLVMTEGVIGGEGLGSESLAPDLGCLHPKLADTLPAPCPVLASHRLLTGVDGSIDSGVVTNPATDYIDANWHAINNPPSYGNWGDWPEDAYDCTDTIRIDAVSARYDWEGGPLLIGVLPEGSPLAAGFGVDGSLEVTEASYGLGGAYAKFYYTIVPHKPSYDDYYATLLSALPPLTPETKPGELAFLVNDLQRCFLEDCPTVKQSAYEALQFLLNLATTYDDFNTQVEALQGEANVPAFKLRSILPGSVFTKNDAGAAMCEWFDMSEHADGTMDPVTMHYQNFGIWDWDMVESNPCVSMIVWEGDNGQTDIGKVLQVIGDYDKLDDFLGYFKMCKSDFSGTTPIPLTNFSGDLTLTVSRGNTVCD